LNEFQQYLVEEFAEDYSEGRLTRREALKMIASITGSVVAASSILAACASPGNTTAAPTPAAATGEMPVTPTPPAAADDTGMPAASATAASAGETAASPTPEEAIPTTGAEFESGTVSPDDPAVQGEPVEFAGQDGAALTGYLARPVSGEPAPVILVCHENRGLTPHIEDVARRLGKAGYVALAVDLLSRQGGTASLSSSDVPGVLGNTDPDQFVQDFLSGLSYLVEQPFANTGQLGMVGFCFGGGVTWRMATHVPELDAAVPFYGPHPPVDEVPNIQAAVLGIYAGNDQRINQGIPAIEEAMLANGKTYEKQVYPNTEHAFHNDTGSRYAPEAARDAWARTLAWFERYVRGAV
jgi:carboxymethylenebutenolidase